MRTELKLTFFRIPQREKTVIIANPQEDNTREEFTQTGMKFSLT